MDFFGDLMGGVAAAASGGVFGLIGSLANRVTKYFETKQQHAFERERWAQEEKMQELNMRLARQETEMELAVVAAEGSYAGLEASHRAEAAIGHTPSWVNAVLRLVRPTLTIMLIVICYFVFERLTNGDLVQWMTEAEIKDLIAYAVMSSFFVMMTAVTWWFGDRAPRPPGFGAR